MNRLPGLPQQPNPRVPPSMLQRAVTRPIPQPSIQRAATPVKPAQVVDLTRSTGPTPSSNVSQAKSKFPGMCLYVLEPKKAISRKFTPLRGAPGCELKNCL